jgi:hypothetical protein
LYAQLLEAAHTLPKEVTKAPNKRITLRYEFRLKLI